jgi:predicted ATPase
MGLLADQLGKAGRLKQGIAVITNAITLAEHTGEGYALADLHRIKGELFLKSNDLLKPGKLLSDSLALSALSQARISFGEALRIANKDGTRWWQLKTALSMYRLEMSQGKCDHTQVAEIYSCFTEGHETADLRQAKALLNSGRSA